MYMIVRQACQSSVTDIIPLNLSAAVSSLQWTEHHDIEPQLTGIHQKGFDGDTPLHIQRLNQQDCMSIYNLVLAHICGDLSNHTHVIYLILVVNLHTQWHLDTHQQVAIVNKILYL